MLKSPFKKILFYRFLFLILGLQIPVIYSLGQTAPEIPEAIVPDPASDKDALKLNLNQSGTQYFQVTFLNQTWLRFNQSNPGTLVQAEPKPETFDIGLRRTRIQMFGQISDRAFVYFQFGQNNFNRMHNSAGNRKIAAFFHDALGEYRITNNNALKLGAGLTIANGLSRFSAPSIGTILTLDVPVFAQATVDQTDQFSRKLSVYARGQAGKLDYRLSLSDPFPITSSGVPQPAPGPNATFALIGHHKQYQTYVTYNFFEMESHLTPAMAGTYLGLKKVLNIGAGLIAQRRATWSRAAEGDTVYHNLLLWSAEAFLDMQLNSDKGNAISAYAGYFNYDYGPNYLRMNGLMNTANGSTGINQITGAGPTFGNAIPMFGTGNIQYAQAGYLLPRNFLGENRGQLQPFAAYTRSRFGRLGKNNTVDVVEIGGNWLIHGHRSKLSAVYQNRPTFSQDLGGNISSGDRKSAVIMQYQIFI